MRRCVVVCLLMCLSAAVFAVPSRPPAAEPAGDFAVLGWFVDPPSDPLCRANGGCPGCRRGLLVPGLVRFRWWSRCWTQVLICRIRSLLAGLCRALILLMVVWCRAI